MQLLGCYEIGCFCNIYKLFTCLLVAIKPVNLVIMSAYKLDAYLQDIKKLCLQYKVWHLYAFGSVLTNNFNAESDVDFMVDFEPVEIEHYADNYYDLKFSLE